LIYIAARSKIACGGCESLHQLYNALSTITDYVRVFYHDFDGLGSPIPEPFAKYNIRYVTQIEDNKTNILITYESLDGLRLLNNFSKIKKIIWWLSVDNYFISNHIGLIKHYYINLGFLMTLKVILFLLYRIIRNNRLKRFIVDFTDDEIIHLYQSHYAKLFLENQKVKNLFSIRDYIHTSLVNTNNSNRDNILLYNPAKGYKFTKRVIRLLEVAIPVPIKGLSVNELNKLYSTSKVYIDFGNHPGRDRIPRESVLNSNIIVTNLSGSAKNDFDIPINNSYKIDIKKFSPKFIATLIDGIMLNYDLNIYDFIDYKNNLLVEKNEFLYEVEFLYNSVLIGYDNEAN
jgi:hypothetical protein